MNLPPLRPWALEPARSDIDALERALVGEATAHCQFAVSLRLAYACAYADPAAGRRWAAKAEEAAAACGGCPDQRQEALMRLAPALCLREMGRPEECLAALDAAAPVVAGAAEPAITAYWHSLCGVALLDLARFGEAVVRIHNALGHSRWRELLPLRIRLINNLSLVASAAGLPGTGMRMAQRVVHLLHVHPLSEYPASRALCNLAASYCDAADYRQQEGDREAARALATQGLQIALLARQQAPQGPGRADLHVRIANVLIRVALQLDDMEAARRYCVDMQALAGASPSGPAQSFMVLAQARVALRAGHWAEVVRIAAPEFEQMGGGSNQRTRESLASVLAEAYAGLGEFERAHRLSQLVNSTLRTKLMGGVDRRRRELEQLLDPRRAHQADYLSHDLRAPIDAIMAAAAVPLAGDALPSIQRYAQRASEVVQRTLDLARLGAHPPRALPVLGLGSIVYDAIEEIEQRWQHKALHFLVADLPEAQMQGDATLLTRLLVNLVDNAAQACRPGGHITLKLDDEGDVVTLHVLDDGPGFDLAQLLSLFGHGPDEAGAVARFGLRLVDLIAELHNGTVIVDNSPTGGAVVSVALPRRQIDCAD